MRILSLALLFLTACPSPTPPPLQGNNMTVYFPLDRNVDCEWEYLSQDNTVQFQMIGRIESSVTTQEGVEHTLAYRKNCFGPDPTCVTGELIRSLVLSENFRGVRLHEVDGVRFETPIVLLNEFMFAGEDNTTSTDGVDYLSTFTEIVAECPVRVPNWNNCAEFTVQGEGGESGALGTFYAVSGFSLVAMDWPDQPGIWQLNDHVLVEPE